MRDADFPQVVSYPLPQELRAPLQAPEQKSRGKTEDRQAPEINDLCEALAPLISASIARKARQRRYTP